MRKLLYILVIVVLLLLLVMLSTNIMGYFSGSKKLFYSIPTSNLAVLYVKDAQQFNQRVKADPTWKDLQNIEPIGKFTDLLEILRQTAGVESLNIPICASLHLTSPQSYEYLLYLQARSFSLIKMNTVLEKLKEKGYELSSHKFDGVSIYELKKDKNSIHLSQLGQNVVLSRNAALIEEAINEPASNVSKIAKYLTHTGKSNDLAIYFNLKNAGLLNTVFSKTGTESSFYQIEKLGEELFAGLSLDNGKIKATGKLNGNNSFLNTLDRAGNFNAQKMGKIAPANSGLSVFQRMDKLPAMTAEAKADFEKYYEPWFAREWAYILPEIQQRQMGACLLLSCSDTKRAGNLLGLLSRTTETENIEDYRTFSVKEFKDNGFVNALLGEYVAKDFEEAFFVVLDDFVLVGSDKKALQGVIDQYINQQSLAQKESFVAFAQHYATGTNICINTPYLAQLFRLYGSDAFLDSYNKYGGSYNSLAPIYLNIENDGDFSASLIHNTVVENEETAIIWNAVLDAPALNVPHVIDKKMDIDIKEGTDGSDGKEGEIEKGSSKKTEKEIWVQDKNYALYALSKSGQRLWKKEFDSPILSKIHPIDLYENGRQQYLFNTVNHIFVVDEKGEPLNNFPIRLSAPATTSLLLTELGKQFMIFIPCENEKIYGFQLDGSPLSGWNPLSEAGLVEQPLKLLQQKDNIFIIAVNAAGTALAFNPSGEIEFVAALEAPMFGEAQIDERDGFKTLVATCTNGKTYTVNQEGTYWAKNYQKLSENALFLTEDLWGGDSEEIIFADGNVVSVFNTAEKQFDFTLDCPVSDLFVAQANDKDNKKYLGAFCEPEQHIYLLDKKGELRPDFPITGTTPFAISDLFDSGEKILFVGGNENNIVARRIKD